MKLNVRLQAAQSPTAAAPLVLLHGLFGNLDNLGGLARSLRKTYQVIQPDIRNHGLSPRSPEMSYPLMAEDIIDTLDDLGIDQFSLIGHSMGGKIAMALTALLPERIEKLVVIDIAPVAYPGRHHDAIFSAINAVTHAGITRRHDAIALMQSILGEEQTEVIMFLLKSFHAGNWRFNVPALWQHYDRLIGWDNLPAWSHPALFIRGERSFYLDDVWRAALLAQFPLARAHVVSGAGHWVHGEKPDAVLRAIERFLA